MSIRDNPELWPIDWRTTLASNFRIAVADDGWIIECKVCSIKWHWPGDRKWTVRNVQGLINHREGEIGNLS